MSAPASAAKRLGRAVLDGTRTVKGKTIQETLKFLSQARPLRGGVERTVASFTRQELIARVGDLARDALGALEVDFAGWATPADAVMAVAGIHDPEQFLTSVIPDLVDESARADRTAPLSAVLGADWIGSANPIMLSAEERTQRLTEGLVTAIGQAHANGIDPAELFKPPLLAYTMRYLRDRIMHSGFDHGNYSELMRAAIFGRLPLRAAPVHQVRIPELTVPFSPNTGYDSLLGHPDYLVPHQNKATEFAKVLMSGTVSPRKVDRSGSWVVSRGDSMLGQKVSDGIRNRRWGHQVPGSTIFAPFPSSVPPGTPGWLPVHHVTIFGLDSPMLVGSVVERLDDAMYRARSSRVVSISALDLPEKVRTQLRAILGVPTVPWDIPREEVERLTLDWLDGFIPLKQAEMNDKLAVAKIRNAIAHPMGMPEVRIYASHQTGRLNDILVELDLLDPAKGPGVP
jgi:hypothetical protein